MMPQSQNADYSNGTNNNALAIAVAPQNGQFSSNNSMSGQISMINNSSVQNQNLMAAALHLNQYTQGYSNPGLATLNYLYPNSNSFVQASNLVFNPHNILHPSVEMIPSGPSSLGHIGNSGLHHNHKLGGYDNMQHFGSMSQNSSRKPKNSVMSKTNLYINGLQESDTDESVRALVEGIIEPKSCKAMMSHGKCRGSGFIDCANETDAERVISILRNKQMPGGTRLAVKFAYENEKDDLNVYVRNLPRTSSFNNSNLEDIFKEYGQVVSVKLLQSDNQYTGTGFVRFSAADEAQKAVDHMNVKKLMLTDDDKPVICKLADKGGRRMNHTMMHLGGSGGGGGGGDSSSQSMEGGSGDHGMANGGSHISSEGQHQDKGTGGYGLPMISHQGHQHHQYSGVQGHPWVNHNNIELQLAHELQSLGLATQNPNYVLPGLMPGALATVPYSEEAAAAVLQQQQMLAQLIWSHQSQQQQQQQHRMMASGYHPSHVPQQQAQSVMHWQQAQHSNNTNNNSTVSNHGMSSHTNNSSGPTTNGNVYFGPEGSYQPMVFAPVQYRHSRPPIPPTNNNATSSTLKSPPLDSVTIINGQTLSQVNQQAPQLPLMNGGGGGIEPL